LLLAVDVDDTSGELENQPKPAKGMWPFWDNDGLEVYIDTLNRRLPDRGESNAHQFFAFPFGTGNDAAIGGYESKIIRPKGAKAEVWTIVPHPSKGPAPMLRAGKKTEHGWMMELLIPKSILREGDLKPGGTIGFELQIDTGTPIYYFWACDQPGRRVSTHPSLWGEAFLAGTDARVEPIDDAMKPSKSFVPGKPLHVRVTDLDMNLDPAKKDQVAVTVRSRSEDVKTLTLEETSPDSGVFVGSLATRVATGVIVPNILEVVSGEDVAIEYVDAGRANGERNGKVQASVRAAP
jgi:hypothetical protein